MAQMPRHKNKQRAGRAASPPEAPGLGLASERKHVSVFFADICESTRRFGDADPEDARSRLEPVLRVMCEAVEAYGGTISQLLGDGVLALFGAPLAQEDHALRACLAAGDLQRRVRGLSAAGGGEVMLRVGIDSGEVAVGKVREFNAAYYRADGTALHRAKRLEQMAPEGSTLIGASTQRLVEGLVQILRPLQLEVRGFSEPLAAFELDHNAVASLARRRQLAPLVGRESVMNRLLEVVPRVRARRLQFLGLRGDAGIGKSRLMQALSERLGQQGFATCWHGVQAWAQGSAYGMIAALTLNLLGLPDSGEDRAQAVARALDAAGEPLSPHRAALADLLGAGPSGAEWDELPPHQRRRRLADAVQAVIESRLAQQPLLIVIDDLFVGDRESQRLLEGLLRKLEHAPLLICGAYRQDVSHRWADHAWFSEFPLGPLSDAEMGLLVREIVGDDASLAGLAGALVERAGGNPFFVEQMVMSLVDEGMLVGEPGHYRCTSGAPALRPPASIAAIVAARVDKLPLAAKQSLECAAVLGGHVLAAQVAAMTGHAEAEVQVSLQRALSAGLLVHAQAAGAEFDFRHALVQEVVAGGLSRPRRRVLHRAAYAALQEQSRAPRAADPDVLAQHAYAGELWPEAAEAAVNAMGRAIGRSANRDALSLFAMGLDAVSRAEVGAAAAALELRLRMTALGALSPLGKMEEAISNLERAHAITRELGDLRRESGVALQLSFVLWVQGQYERGLQAAAAAQASAQRTAGRSAQMAAQQARMMLRHGQGRYRDVLADARRAEQEFAPEIAELRLLPRWTTVPSLNLRAFSASALTALGDLAAAQACCDLGYAELKAFDHPYSRLLLDWVQGDLWLAAERWQEAATLLADACRRCRNQDVPTMEPPLRAWLCVALARLGRGPEALEMIEHAIDARLAELGGRYNAYYFPIAHAQVLQACGRPAQALVRAREAVAQADAFGQRGYQAQAALLAGELALSVGEPVEAARHLAQALTLAAECGMARVEARAAAGLAALPAGPGTSRGA
jgi:predicted ATPase/class 3 adenylate cyclase